MQKTNFTLLIVDKNPNVRGFLKREMEAEGYSIHLAENGRQTIQWIHRQTPVDLVVLDPDLPDTDKCEMLTSIWGHLPPLPTVIHTFASIYNECSQCGSLPAEAVFVEKRGNSIERLKQVVFDILKHPSTRRSGSHTTDAEPHLQPGTGETGNGED